MTPTQFESFPLYALQTILIAAVVYLLVWRQPLILRLQVLGWAAGVLTVALQYGVVEQLGFYSNDQVHYASVLDTLINEKWPSDSFWWLEFSKIPYPAAAYPLALLGIHGTLALKTVSLVCLLALSRAVVHRHAGPGLVSQAKVLYLTSCGLIGSFFSLLGLRETMMMYFTYRYTSDKSLSGRLISIGIIFLLRSHLAAALIGAELVLAMWRWFTERRRIGFAELPVLTIGGVLLGNLMYSVRLISLTKVKSPLFTNFGREATIRIASNFAGLQFITTDARSLKLSISELVYLRLLFSETILIPLIFITVCLICGNRLTERDKFTYLAFCIYISVVTNTELNSFRQNIPFMPLMGLVVLGVIRSRRADKSLTTDEPDIPRSAHLTSRET